MRSHFAQRMQHVKPSAIREMLAFGADQELISLAGGYPDATMFPVKELEESLRTAVVENGKESLQYTLSAGIPRLRAQIADRMTKGGVPCAADEIQLLNGSQQGLDLLGKLFINKGDLVITEGPTFLGAPITLAPFEPRHIAISMDAEGLDVDELRRVLERGEKPKLLYTVPDFQNPTGVTLSVERRKRLVELANEFDFHIVEDSPYRDLRFHGSHLLPIKSFDTQGRVIYLGSFSKTLVPGFRLGYAIGSRELIQPLELLKLAADTQCSTLNMFAVSIYLDRFDFEGHIRALQQVYRRKKEAMVRTIRETFPDSVTTTDPDGGMFAWLTFPDGFDAGQFMSQRAVPEAKVGFVPGEAFFPVSPRKNHARLSFSMQTEERIEHGVRALGKLLKEKDVFRQ
jgi:2-aminoadipate transaminase